MVFWALQTESLDSKTLWPAMLMTFLEIKITELVHSILLKAIETFLLAI
jgi:hypothetical protein